MTSQQSFLIYRKLFCLLVEVVAVFDEDLLDLVHVVPVQLRRVLLQGLQGLPEQNKRWLIILKNQK